MSSRLLLLAAVATMAVAQPVGGEDDPRRIAAAAVRAVEGDSVPRVQAAWEARLRRDANDRAAALALSSLALLTYDVPRAERLARPLESGAGDAFTLHWLLASVTSAQGRGEFLGSVPVSERALALARRLRDRDAEAMALLQLSVTRSALGDPRAGAATLDTMAPLLADDALELRALYHGRRAWHVARFGPGSADAEIGRCLELSRRARSLRAESTCEWAQFLEHLRQGDLEAELKALAREEALHRRTRNLHYLSRAMAQRASILMSMHEYGAVQGPLEESIRIANRSGRLAVYQLVDMAEVALSMRDYDAARSHATRAVTVLDSLGLAEGAASARSALARIAAATGELAEARRLHGEQLAWAERAGYHGIANNSRLAIALLAVAEGRLDEAERVMAVAVAREREWGVMRTGIDVHALIAIRRRNWARADSILVDALGRLNPDQQAMAYQFRTRLAYVRAMQGRIDDAAAELRAGVEKFDGWRATLDDADLRALAFELNTDPDPDYGYSATLAAMARAGRAAEAFELPERRRARELADQLLRASAMRTDDPASRRAVAPPRRAALATARLGAALPPGTALLEYTVAPHAPTTVFVVTRDGVRARVLAPVDSLAPLVQRFGALLESGTAPTALARQLGAALLDPAVAGLGADVTRLVVVPDGALHHLAFDALTLADGRYAVERFAVSTAPSAAVAAELWRRAPTRRLAAGARAHIVALGDPQFDGGGDDAGSERFRSAFAAAGGLPRLEASGREVQEVARYAGLADVRVRDGASEAYLKRAVRDSVDVLHLATHALVDERSAARTAVALAPGDGEDGFLTPGELAALPLSADLVVLSACRTAGGKLVAGEGVQGLTAPLLAAGVRSIVATQWRIGDRATVPLVDAFYAALARGLSVGDALREAKLDAIRRGAPPGEWAAFTVVGDATVSVPLRTPASPRTWLLALAGTTTVAAAATLLVRRRKNAGTAE